MAPASAFADEAAKTFADTDTVATKATLVFDHTSKIASPVSGRIAKLPAEIGSLVKRGDVVFQIDTEQLKADRDIAARELANAEAQLTVAESQLALQKTVQERAARLKQSAAFSAAKLEDADRLVELANSNIALAKSQIEVKRAELERRDVDIRLATVVSPIDGMVVSHLLTVGGYVSPEDPNVMVVADTSSPEIAMELDTLQAQQLAVGQVIAYKTKTGRQESGKVRAVLPQGAPGSRLSVVRIEPAKRTDGSPWVIEPVTVFVPNDTFFSGSPLSR